MERGDREAKEKPSSQQSDSRVRIHCHKLGQAPGEEELGRPGWHWWLSLLSAPAS